MFSQIKSDLMLALCHEKRIWARASCRTIDFFGINKRTLITFPLLLVAGFGIYYFWQGREKVMEELITWVAFGFAPAAIFAFLLLLWNAVIAGPKTAEGARQRIESLEQQLARKEIDERIAADLVVKYEEAEELMYSASQEDPRAQYDQWNETIQQWVDEVENYLYTNVSRLEGYMFRTIVTDVAEQSLGETLEKLQARMNKLRLITSRCLERAEGTDGNR